MAYLTDTRELLEIPERIKMAEMIDALDAYCLEVFDEYQRLLKELDQYRGHVVSERNVKDINALLFKVQEKFNVLFPLFNYINERYPITMKLTAEYKDFMKEVEKTDAQIPQRV